MRLMFLCCDREAYVFTTHVKTQPTACHPVLSSQPNPNPFSPGAFL